MALIIKFRSIDGLVLFEKWTRPGFPPDTLHREGTVLPLYVRERDDFPVPVKVHRRQYLLYGDYVDKTTGDRVWEYREDSYG